jgi:exopolyphosphatase / guanosine-5'-triphosphate,3'-diphosphate pyrophosphatase
VAQFTALAREKNAESLRLIATSAARDAHNKQDLITAVRRASGLTLEIISGGQEAEWVYQGVRSDPALVGKRLLILDVGGGSAEFIIGTEDRPEFSHSFELGRVRLLEHLRLSDPPTAAELERCRNFLREFFTQHIYPVVAPILRPGLAATQFIGTGGTATILARMEYALNKYERHKIDGARIPLHSIERWMQKLWSLTLEERKNIIGLPKKRADVILPGMAIYEAVLQQFGFEELCASTRGLRFAAVLQPAPLPPSLAVL